MIEFEGGAFGRSLGYEGELSWMGLVPLEEDTQEKFSRSLSVSFSVSASLSVLSTSLFWIPPVTKAFSLSSSLSFSLSISTPWENTARGSSLQTRKRALSWRTGHRDDLTDCWESSPWKEGVPSLVSTRTRRKWVSDQSLGLQGKVSSLMILPRLPITQEIQFLQKKKECLYH